MGDLREPATEAELLRHLEAKLGRKVEPATRYLAKPSVIGWNDAHTPAFAVSTRSRISEYFEAGYTSLFAMTPLDARKTVKRHPDVGLIRTGCAVLGLPAAAGARLVENQYSPDDEDRPTERQIRAWAQPLMAALW
jgi:hypothetical protein